MDEEIEMKEEKGNINKRKGKQTKNERKRCE